MSNNETERHHWEKNKDKHRYSLFRRQRTWQKKKSLPSIMIKRWPRLIHSPTNTIYTQLISSLLHNFNNYPSKQLSWGVFSTLSHHYPGGWIRSPYTGRIRLYMTQIRRLYGRIQSNTGRIHAVFCWKPGRCFTTVFTPYRIRCVCG